MSEDVNNSNTLDDGGLPVGFWAAPDTFIPDPNLQFLHSETISRLRQDSPGADTLQLMLMERVATLYIYMRSREQESRRPFTDGGYKNVLQLWVSMAADLRKSQEAGMAAEAARIEILSAVKGAINSAVSGLDPDVAHVVRRRMAENLATV